VIVHGLYDAPTWLACLVVIASSTLVTCLVLIPVRRWLASGRPILEPELRREYNDIIGATGAIVGTVCAVLLAFTAVVTWETFSKGEEIAEAEANDAANLYLNAAGLPKPASEELRAYVRSYVELVIQVEWPAQRGGHLDASVWVPAWRQLVDLNLALARFEPTTQGQSNTQAEMLRTLNDLYKERRSRLLATGGHIAEVVWWIILLAVAITAGYTFLFRIERLGMHTAITGSIVAMMMLVVLLIFELDHPFRGEMSVGTGSFESVQATMREVQQHR
jgi:hypothetical protein